MMAIAMGVGRFAYTPLLAAMERDAGLSVSLAGTLAFANLFGYLVGSLLAMSPFAHRHRLAIARGGVATVIVTTGLMAGAHALWIPLRFVTGVASGLVLIFTASIVIERAAREHKPAWPPLLFSGVGFGIAFSGVAVPALVAHGGSRVAWIGLALVSAAAAIATGRWFGDEATAPVPAAANATGTAPMPDAGAFAWLLAVYTAEAFAYIIPATFLVAIVTRLPSLARYASASWVLVGLAAAGSTGLWIRVGARVGKARALALALAVQGLGIAAPMLTHGPLAVVVAAIALGGTFIAITLFAAGLARDMFPHRTSAAISRLTVLYSVGQMIGPVVATSLALRFGSYAPALVCAAAIAGIAAVTTVFRVRDSRVAV